jgi:hypothetical protein
MKFAGKSGKFGDAEKRERQCCGMDGWSPASFCFMIFQRDVPGHRTCFFEWRHLPLVANMMHVINQWLRKSLGQEFARPAAQVSEQGGCPLWTERTEAIHG